MYCSRPSTTNRSADRKLFTTRPQLTKVGIRTIPRAMPKIVFDNALYSADNAAGQVYNPHDGPYTQPISTTITPTPVTCTSAAFFPLSHTIENQRVALVFWNSPLSYSKYINPRSAPQSTSPLRDKCPGYASRNPNWFEVTMT